MNLYLTSSISPLGMPFTEFASSDSNASKVRTRLKKAQHTDIGTIAHEVPTTRTGLIEFLNSQFASLDE